MDDCISTFLTANSIDVPINPYFPIALLERNHPSHSA